MTIVVDPGYTAELGWISSLLNSSSSRNHDAYVLLIVLTNYAVVSTSSSLFTVALHHVFALEVDTTSGLDGPSEQKDELAHLESS